MCCTWWPTVLGEMKSFFPISRLECPWTRRRRTSSSRSLRPSAGAGRGGRAGGAVGTILAEGAVDVGGGEEARALRLQGGRDPAGISRAVHALMVRGGELAQARQR